MAEHRGRPKEFIAEVLEKWEVVTYEVPTKPELGWKSTRS